MFFNHVLFIFYQLPTSFDGVLRPWARIWPRTWASEAVWSCCEVVVEFFGEAGGKGDAELPRQCAELYGLFQRKNIMEAPTDATLRVNFGKPKGLANLEDDKAPGGLFIQHTASHQWYHCFILGKKVRESIGIGHRSVAIGQMSFEERVKTCENLGGRGSTPARSSGWMPREQAEVRGHGTG